MLLALILDITMLGVYLCCCVVQSVCVSVSGRRNIELHVCGVVKVCESVCGSVCMCGSVSLSHVLNDTCQ